MKVDETVRQMTIRVAIGTAFMTAVMLAVYVLLGQAGYAVILGAVLGCTVAVLDFFLMGLTIQSASALQATVPVPPQSDDEEAEKAPDSDAQIAVSKKIRKKIQRSQMGRMAMIVACAALAGALPCFDLLATLLPLLFPKLVIYFLRFMGMK